MITVLEFTRSSSLRKKSTTVGSLFSPIRIPFLSKIALLTNGKVEAIIDEVFDAYNAYVDELIENLKNKS